MIPRYFRWLAPLVLMALWTTLALAAAGAGGGGGDDESGPAPRVPVLGYFLAFVFTVATLVIVCMPSRKS
jgi:hypothetical protein